ncbi:MAG: peptide-methionine (S)-S-oxide reductase MsrA [Acidobacteriaceae bacterium]|nr:peptide-methionine (S)-S-oxide reductase MsrA [Acidobacteriaceae bacterium]
MFRQMMTIALLAGLGCSAAPRMPLPAPAQDIYPAKGDPAKIKGRQKAVLAGGCFWCTEAVFEAVAGVEKVVSGYSGGDLASATYEMVGSGRTRHAESIEVTYDPAKISYGRILQIFFAVAHDPTQLNRQGPDYGPQYRSAIFYGNEEERRVAAAYIAQLEQAKVFSGRIVTELAPLKAFYPAEDYHQDFVKRNPNHPYVVVNSAPKVAKLRKEFAGQLKP